MTKDDLYKCAELNDLIGTLIRIAKSEHPIAMRGVDDDHNTLPADIAPTMKMGVLDHAIKAAGRATRAHGGTAKKFRSSTGWYNSETKVWDLLQFSKLHTSLLWQIGYNGGRHMYIYEVRAVDAPGNSEQAILPPEIGTATLQDALASVGDHLRTNGMDVSDEPEHDCFECGGTGKVAMGDRCR